MWIGHRKEIWKLTFQALAHRRSTTVSLETYPLYKTENMRRDIVTPSSMNTKEAMFNAHIVQRKD